MVALFFMETQGHPFKSSLIDDDFFFFFFFIVLLFLRGFLSNVCDVKSP